jgi:tripeptide aminopeptidase
MNASERLLKYVLVHTSSDENSAESPSSTRQFVLADMLARELEQLGAENVVRDEHCYVYGTIPASAGCESAPAIGFIAHMDTAPDFSGENVKPNIISGYDGLDITLPDGKIISRRKFRHLEKLKGRTIITTDGTTLLGADDKAGIAEIMTAAEQLINSGAPHPKVCIAFTPDEEIGRGVENFDMAKFGADFAYTVDGGQEGEISYENFNAARAKITIHGVNVHPGEAKGVMVNAVMVANEIISLLPSDERPENTEGTEGFYHVMQLNADVEKAEISLIIRDHDEEIFEYRKNVLAEICSRMNDLHGSGTVTLEINDQYRNMAQVMEKHMHLVDNAAAAVKDAGAEPVIVPIRGGTDGAMLSFRGLPCPNLGTGGYLFHGPYEHISVEGMDISVKVILGIIWRYTPSCNAE